MWFWKWEVWPWNWRKVRKAQISEADRDIFERYGESVVASILASNPSTTEIHAYIAGQDYEPSSQGRRAAARDWLTECRDAHERREQRLESIEIGVVALITIEIVLSLLFGFLGLWEGWKQGKALDRQLSVLSHVDSSAAATSNSLQKLVAAQDASLQVLHAQATAAQENVKAIQRQTRQDQRPWLALTMDWPSVKNEKGEIVAKVVQVTENQALAVPMQLINSGKTAARQVQANIFVEVVKATEGPHLNGNSPAWHFFAGIIVPNTPSRFFAYRQLPDKAGLEAMSNLTAAENQELSAGRVYLAVYGEMTYRDVFDVAHWTKFCGWVPLNLTPRYYNSKSCSDYNSVDNN
jgi:hypothetical protein